MRKVVALLAFCAFSLTAPLSAQTSEERGLAWQSVNRACSDAQKEQPQQADKLIATCSQALTELASRYADPALKPKDDTEENFYWSVVMRAHSGRTTAYTLLDKARSRRVCDGVFAQNSAAAHFKREAWPDEEYRQAIDKLLASAVSPTAKCRAEFGV